MEKAIAVVVIAVLSLVAACAPIAPTPTPAPTPTAVEVRATKPEHLEGIWLYWDYLWETQPGDSFGGPYYRWDTDGTVSWADDAEMTGNLFTAKFWFEDGRYYEDSNHNCFGTGVYEVYLRIEGGRAIRLRMQLKDDPDCGFRRDRYPRGFIRVD